MIQIQNTVTGRPVLDRGHKVLQFLNRKQALIWLNRRGLIDRYIDRDFRLIEGE